MSKLEHTFNHHISVQSKSYLPTTVFGLEATWESTRNEYFEIYDTGVIVALKEGSAEVNCTLIQDDKQNQQTFNITVTAYDKKAYNHIIETEKALISSVGNGNYTITFYDDFVLNYSIFTINGCDAIGIDELETDPTSKGKIFGFNVADYGAETLQNIKIKFRKDAVTDKNIISGRVVMPLNIADEAIPPQTYINGKNSVIACWGDSITQSTVGKTYSYPAQLAQLLNGQHMVYNAGDAGETSTAILSRANIVNVYLKYDIKFEADSEYSEIFYRGRVENTSDRVYSRRYIDCWVKDTEGNNIYYTINGNQLPITDVKIGGVNYELVDIVNYSTMNPWGCNQQFKLKRTGDISQALTLRADSQVIFDYSSLYNNIYCSIVLFGANGSSSGPYSGTGESVQRVISEFKAMNSTAEKTLYVIPFFWQNDVTDDFVKAFGADADKLINLREYLTCDAFEDYDVIPTRADLEWMEKDGRVPPCFWAVKSGSYDCHLNKLGYKIMADLIYKRGAALGYWK